MLSKRKSNANKQPIHPVLFSHFTGTTMSFNPFQLAQQQQLQQIPTDRLLYPPAAQLPALQGVQFSNNMMPFAEKVVTEAINKIQAAMSQNEPRIYFFNLMASNGYDNPQFRDFVTTLQRVCETAILAQGKHPEQVIPLMTDAFTTYSVALNALNNPNLIQRTPSNMVQAMQQIVSEFQNTINQMQANANRPMQQPTQQQPQNQIQQNYGVFGGGPSGVFTNNSPVAASVSPVLSMNIASPTAGQYQAPVVAPFAQAQPFQTTTAMQAFSQPAPIIQVSAPAPSGTPTIVNVSDISKTQWVPSTRWPTMPTYDPNKEEMKFFIYSDGAIQPVIAQKENMDRQAHLAPISITPQWSAISQKLVIENPAMTNQTDAHRKLTADDVSPIMVPNVDKTSTSHKDNFLFTEAYLLSQRNVPKNADKVVFAVKQAFVVDTIIATDSVGKLIQALLVSTTAKAAASLLEAACKEAAYSQNHLNYRSINRLIERLTRRVNRFISVDMSLNFGRIDNYVEDAPVLAAFLTKKLGAASGELFEKAHRQLVIESVTKADSDLRAKIEVGEFAQCVLPEAEGLSYSHLYNRVAYGCIDASSIELRAQIPVDQHSVLISESSTPFLRSLATFMTNLSILVTKSEEEDAYDCDRFLLRTNDGVTLEIAYAAFNPSELVVSLFNAAD